MPLPRQVLASYLCLTKFRQIESRVGQLALCEKTQRHHLAFLVLVEYEVRLQVHLMVSRGFLSDRIWISARGHQVASTLFRLTHWEVFDVGIPVMVETGKASLTMLWHKGCEKAMEMCRGCIDTCQTDLCQRSVYPYIFVVAH
jgi:hypothetical protein